MSGRRIRVHLPGYSTFVITTRDGIVVKVSHELFQDFIGESEGETAAKLRALGSTFVDLIHERQQIALRRGYRARADRIERVRDAPQG